MGKKPSLDVLKIHNDVNMFSIGDFNAVEANVFSATCLEMYNANGEDIVLSIHKLKELSGYTDSNKRFMSVVKSVARKILRMSAYSETEGVVKEQLIFSEYTLNTKKGTLEIKVNPERKALFCDLVERYMKYSHRDYCSLPTSYAKSLYRLCAQWNSVGHFTVEVEYFRFVMGIPDSFRTGMIDKRVIEPAIEALQDVFKNLACEKVYAKPNGRGRSRVSAYRFSFVPNNKRKERSQYEEHIDKAKELGIAEETAHALWLMGAVGEDKLMEICADIRSGVPF